MIFSSYPFLLLLLPSVFALFLICRRAGWTAAATTTLLAGSIVFYLAWSWRDGVVLLASVLINYWIGQQQIARPQRAWLVSAIVCNLGVLVYFKYASFLFGFLPVASQWQWILPLGISFYTFQQIAWHVDLYQRRLTTTGGLLRYSLFVTFFPQLIAGPIVHARDIIPRFCSGWLRRALPWKLGMALLCMGLAKKVLLADSIGPGIDGLFDSAARGLNLSAVEVIIAAFGYGLQLYFDFSGYGDMAVGLGLMFGLRLPTNFRAPYRSCSIVDFWRRWHITLSHFLRDYLYSPLGGNRGGSGRRSLNLMLTMLLGGLWHGAGWQFVVWGGIHGLMLVLTHSWRQWAMPALPRGIALGLTVFSVMLAWIPFRASSLDVALAMYGNLAYWSAIDTVTLGTLFDELSRLDVRASLPWILPLLLAIAIYGKTSLQFCLRINDWQRGALIATLLLMVLKTLAERPDRAFLYFNF